MTRTTACVIGGGPAGMVLGLLLARAGVEVTVLEKHGDFLRDFRGDTVHPTTMALLDELGLGEKFAQLPQRRVDRAQVPVGPEGQFLTLGDFTQLRTKYNYIAMVPQWDLLDLLANAGAQEPTFHLRMNTEATSLIRERGRVNGVRYRTSDGETGDLRATITVACDGRDSLARELPELGLRDFSTPMDVWWFRLPRLPHDTEGIVAKMSDGKFTFLIDRGDYYQAASLIPKGTDAASRARPIEEFNRTLVDLLPWLADRGLLRSWDDVKLLSVKLDRMRRWHVPGLLCIGDAAHAMSPVGGVGINLAVQDAVAAARHLAEPLRDGTLGRANVAAIQRRRWPTTVLIQGLQRAIHTKVVRPALAGEIDFSDAARLPLPLRVAQRVPWARRIPPYLLAYGAMREHPPAAALR
ncbi:2-polyprenyl-6-methoxyphenol hydroxylase-like FAD-dependent oxidoreductase [Lipingzhangella halophila]|uniref:2-polyprenyl-6-methoxyphenol hydroxylase-like FAD-dependent oxidoreductase n=1 Tax=Lipingzhangella halophila TaxID=1783352 RepID=A0A7W7RP19_9ACTN|nr:FAD-dependent oxidoreductase [Lipingzhangella halophila]MBB4935257.1 2-polyprenyl-6-methoxyphenol hydroxylase-like FAD-dependent oxidoreductase [Lipingzhangella halophila]